MSELAAAGAALYASPVQGTHHQEEAENMTNQELEKSNLAVPENDSISSSDSEADEVPAEEAKESRAKTLPNRANGISSLKRSFTLPRNPLLSLNKPAVKKAKKNELELLESSKKTVRTLLKDIVKQVQRKSQKQTSEEVSEERIAEWKRKFTAENRVPGVIGIRNHGNTCFINAILQCLSYTDILAEYFVLDMYKGDLKRKKKLQTLTALYKRNASELCGKGEVTEQLATLLKSLWSLQYDPEISIRFKSLVEKHASQYKGGSQHDAQEFLLWLLDRVHEDLNVRRRFRIAAQASGSSTNSTNVSTTTSSPSDEVLAAESLANYMRFKNSVVMDVFQAQFRSSLTCPMCEKQSNTFDPFVCVSLPIPQKQLMPVFVTVLYIDQTPRQVKLGLTIAVHETIGDLRTMLAKDTGIERSQILLTEIDDLTFHRTFKDSDPVTVISKDSSSNSRALYCIEVMKHKEATEDDGAYTLLTWVNVLKEGPIEKRFASPYTIQVSREILYQDLQKLLMKEMASILHDDILISHQKVPLFKIRVLDGLEGANYLDANVDLPMYTEAIEQAIGLCSIDEVVPHVKLVLEWDAPAKSQIIADDQDIIEEHSSVKQVEKSPTEASIVTLEECFSLYTKAEKLTEEDKWLCPQCNRQQEAVKRIGLWSLPDVLIIHLKRFQQTKNASNKLSIMVDCPLESYDMKPFVTKSSSPKSPVDSQSSQQHEPENQPSSTVSPPPPPPSSGPQNLWTNLFKKSDKADTYIPDKNSFVYDLYAVCNHHGEDLQGGHYTATCRNPTDGQWYSFDDMHTSKVEEAEVVNNNAYILFYQKQIKGGSQSSSSSSSSSTSSSNQEHWVYRMPDFHYKHKLTKAQQQQQNLKAVTSGSSTTTTASKTSPQNKAVPPTTETKSSVEQVKIEKDEEKSKPEVQIEVAKKEEDVEEEEVTRPVDRNDVD